MADGCETAVLQRTREQPFAQLCGRHDPDFPVLLGRRYAVGDAEDRVDPARTELLLRGRGVRCRLAEVAAPEDAALGFDRVGTSWAPDDVVDVAARFEQNVVHDRPA